MLRNSNDYHDLGAAPFQRGDQARLVAGLTHRLRQLGYEVTRRAECEGVVVDEVGRGLPGDRPRASHRHVAKQPTCLGRHLRGCDRATLRSGTPCRTGM
jgi:hypothetical protein